MTVKDLLGFLNLYPDDMVLVTNQNSDYGTVEGLCVVNLVENGGYLSHPYPSRMPKETKEYLYIG